MKNELREMFYVRRGKGQKSMNRRKTGTEKEQIAAAYLQEHGMRILEMNYRYRQGEIDIIGMESGYLTFVEVKYRKDEQMGLPEEAVHIYKQRKICTGAKVYCYLHGMGTDCPIRFDVVAICGEQIRWYRNAFYMTG